MQYKIISTLILAFFVLPFAGNAQKDLPAEQVEVLKRFEATLLDTKKQSTAGSLPKEDRSKNKLSYSLPTKNLEIQQPAPKIRPLGMKKDKLPEAYKGYVKAGYGIPASPYAEFGYHIGNDPLRVNIHAKHHSANFKNLEHQKYAKTFAEVDAKYSTESNIGFSAGISLDKHKVHFYGYDHEDTTNVYSEDQIKQIFTDVSIKLGIANEERIAGDIDYRVTAEACFFKDNYASKEQDIDIGLGGTKWIGGKHPIKLDVHTDFTRFEDTLPVQNLNNIHFIPSFTYHGDAFSMKVGANIVSYKDEFTFFPDLELSVNVIGSSLTAFAGWTGNHQKNTFKSLATYNPFITSYPRLRNTTYTKYYGGIRGSFRGAEYSAQLGYKNAKDLALFLNDTIDTKRFDILYDTVNIFYIEGSAKFSLFKGFDFIGTLSQSVYSPENEEKAWHLPALESNIAAIYRMPEQKIKVKGELYIANGAPYKKIDDRTVDNLGALLDLSFGAEYGVTDRIGIFLDINNLLNNKRQRWNGYKVYGLNVLGGVFAKF